ncbi:hypothetical protein ACJRO7_007600 [Eucalyptus globulus]|uniref:Uncharacterized protein n=1 Tax=Eucalyptus globulus TaxID=34317 RepID=A0ABD3IPA2_EUCGL
MRPRPPPPNPPPRRDLGCGPRRPGSRSPEVEAASHDLNLRRGALRCNVCQKVAMGFSYHRQECKLDLHSLRCCTLFIPVTLLEQQVNSSRAWPSGHSVSITTVPGLRFINHPSVHLADQLGFPTMRFPSISSGTWSLSKIKRKDWGESSVMGHVLHGIIDGLTQQAGTAIFQGFIKF